MAGGVSAAVVRRKELDVLVKLSAIELVLDSVVGEMNLVVEVRKVVVVRPLRDFSGFTIGAAIGIVAIPITFVEPPLVVALELVVEDDTIDAGAAVREALRLTKVRAIDLDVVFEFARLLETRVELLLVLLTMVSMMISRAVAAVRLEHVATLFSQRDYCVAMAMQPSNADQSLVAQMAQIA